MQPLSTQRRTIITRVSTPATIHFSVNIATGNSITKAPSPHTSGPIPERSHTSALFVENLLRKWPHIWCTCEHIRAKCDILVLYAIKNSANSTIWGYICARTPANTHTSGEWRLKTKLLSLFITKSRISYAVTNVEELSLIRRAIEVICGYTVAKNRTPANIVGKISVTRTQSNVICARTPVKNHSHAISVIRNSARNKLCSNTCSNIRRKRQKSLNLRLLHRQPRYCHFHENKHFIWCRVFYWISKCRAYLSKSLKKLSNQAICINVCHMDRNGVVTSLVHKMFSSIFCCRFGCFCRHNRFLLLEKQCRPIAFEVVSGQQYGTAQSERNREIRQQHRIARFNWYSVDAS